MHLIFRFVVPRGAMLLLDSLQHSFYGLAVRVLFLDCRFCLPSLLRSNTAHVCMWVLCSKQRTECELLSGPK